MRVTIVGLNYVPEPTGIAPYTAGLAEDLSEQGCQTTVITGLPHYPQWRRTDGYHGHSAQTIGGVRVVRRWHPVPAGAKHLHRLLMEVVFGIGAMLSRWRKPDVLVLVSPALFSCLIVSLRAHLFRIPVLVWVQDLYGQGMRETGVSSGLMSRVVARAERFLLSQSSRVVVIHERFRSSVVDRLGVDDARVRVIRNWSHLAGAPEGSRTARRATLDWPEDVTVVLHAGNMGSKQGLENVVAASEVAAARDEKVLFVLLGDGNQRAALQEQGANPCLQFVPTVPENELVEALAAADVLLVNERPGVAEMAVPSKLTSYFTTGLPVIAATDAGSATAQEMDRSGGGIRIDAGAPEQLVAASLHFAADREHAAQLGRMGVRYRQECLSQEAAMSAFRDVLSELAAPGSTVGTVRPLATAAAPDREPATAAAA